MLQPTDNDQLLFEGFKIWLEETALDEHIYRELAHVLQSTAATLVSRIAEADVVVAQHLNFRGCAAALQRGDVVTPHWIYASFRIHRVQTPAYYSADPGKTFSGVVICTTGLDLSDREVVCAGVVSLGGQWRDHLTTDVTHLLAAAPDGKKYETALRYGPDMVVVLPHWFDDCLKLRRRLNEHNYKYPQPPLWDPEKRLPPTANPGEKPDKRSDFGQRARLGVLNDKLYDLQRVPRSPPAPGKRQSFLKRYRFRFASDVQIAGNMAEELRTLVMAAGGEFVNDGDLVTPSQAVDASGTEAEGIQDVLVCRERNCLEYPAAVRAGWLTGNLIWLYYILLTESFACPTEQLLHYPYPGGPIPEMRRLKISVTNYVGPARDYIQCLIEQTGAQFTKSMSKDNTHLICAAKYGTKYEKALEWNIEIVNHLWIEEVYQSQQLRPVSRSEYQHFPAIPNQLLDTVGSTSIRMECVMEELNRLEVAAETASALDLYPDRSQKVVYGATKRSAKRPAETQRLLNAKRSKSATSATAGADTGERATPKSACGTGGGGSGHTTPSTPATPPVLGKVHILKRSQAAQVATRNWPEGVFIAATRFNLEPYQKGLERLGAKVFPSDRRNIPFEKITHLVANSLEPRTEKILFSVIYGKHIVTSDWIAASLQAGQLLDEGMFALKDEVNEKKFDMKLERVLTLARTRPVFEGKTIYEYDVDPVFLNLARASGAKISTAVKIDVEFDGPALQDNRQAFIVVKQAAKLQRILPLVNSLRKRFLPLRVHYPDLILNAVTKQLIEPHLFTCRSWAAD